MVSVLTYVEEFWDVGLHLGKQLFEFLLGFLLDRKEKEDGMLRGCLCSLMIL